MKQSNTSTALAAALNANQTKQSIDQEQRGGRDMDRKKHGADPVMIQAAGQLAASKQKADADADSYQCGVTNWSSPVLLQDKAKAKTDKRPARKHWKKPSRNDGKRGVMLAE